MQERDLDMEQNGFKPLDFATDDIDAALQKEFHTNLIAEYRSPFEIRVWSESHENIAYDLDHDGEKVTFCPCLHYKYGHNCKHLKRVMLVLIKKSLRENLVKLQEQMTPVVRTNEEKRESAPLNGNKPFSLL